ncbi:homogentisate 1,2-dioxygenase [Altererythrobacter sp. FM1]|uniref:homogentisate 1,2-dioxygenase n=1 Tax=Tsuneonella flava TaxID=2055955 RepID=UPI000C80B795|nr:homogentisate 1,2-dioxygenase [Tsuneonella flava]ROT97373.1 homogentisate 1,2-dioxygenase [Altererythrobacter sp. FM1]
MNDISDAKQFAATGEARGALDYQVGFGNEFETEAVVGALPQGQNSPQRAPHGLYSELVSGTAFYTPRHLNRRSYTFRIRPSVFSMDYQPWDGGVDFRTPPLDVPPLPNRMRWLQRKDEGVDADFLEGITTLMGCGSPNVHEGIAVHFYRATRSMENRVFSNADGEMIIVPQQGDLRIVTEFGVIEAGPCEFVLMPRGVKFRVELMGAFARGLIYENYGHPWVLPDLGLIGSNGLANQIDFQAPVASFEDKEVQTQLIHKLGGKHWTVDLDHSPFDVVAWRGSLTPYKYDMRKFVAMSTSTVDHPDPSIFCALTSPAHDMSGCNADFMILPPRWIVGDKTLHLPGFHRNTVAEISSIVCGLPEMNGMDLNGSIGVTNNWTPHGPDAKAFEAVRAAENLDPRRVENLISILVETRYPLEFTQAAMDMKERIRDINAGLSGYVKRFPEG